MKRHNFPKNTRLHLTAFFIGILTLLVTAQSCKKSEDTTTTPTPTPIISIVGTWSLADATITVGTKTQTISRENAIKSSYISSDDITFSSDGKYTQGKTSGTWKTSATKLTIDTKTVEMSTLSNTDLQIGNNYPDVSGTTSAEKDAAGLDAVFITQKLLDVINGGAFSPTTDKTAKYQLNYRRK